MEEEGPGRRAVGPRYVTSPVCPDLALKTLCPPLIPSRDPYGDLGLAWPGVCRASRGGAQELLCRYQEDGQACPAAACGEGTWDRGGGGCRGVISAFRAGDPRVTQTDLLVAGREGRLVDK